MYVCLFRKQHWKGTALQRTVLKLSIALWLGLVVPYCSLLPSQHFSTFTFSIPLRAGSLSSFRITRLAVFQVPDLSPAGEA